MAEDHVVVSEIAIDEQGCDTLEDAFRNRLGEVDGFPGFRKLEVWRDPRRTGRYLMVSWWDSPEAFRSYMRSDEHRRSHDRIPTDPVRPRAAGVDRFDVVAR